MPIYELDGDAPEFPADGKYWVAETAVLIGRVRLLSHASVWFGAVLRGDNEWITIGAGTNLQEHVIVHTDPGFPVDVGENCTIGHRVILHGCTVESGSFVGMRATVMDGAVVESGAMVAAGALVGPGKRVPKGDMWGGTPARFMRKLSEAEIADLPRGAAGYVELAAQYKNDLKL